jgi:signal transduction histidine kinase/HAMP domain-containing protein
MFKFSGIKTAFAKTGDLIDWRHKLRTKIVWMVFLLGGLPLTIFALIAGQISVAYVHVNAVQQNQERAAQIARVLDAYYINHFDFIQNHLAGSEIGWGLADTPESLRHLFTHLLGEFSDAVALEAKNAQGGLLLFSSRNSKKITPVVFKKIGLVPPVNSSEFFSQIGTPYFIPQLNDIIVAITFRRGGSGKNFATVLTVYYSLMTLWDMHLGLHFNDHSTAMLLDAQGHDLFQNRWDYPGLKPPDIAISAGSHSRQAVSRHLSWLNPHTWFKNHPGNELVASATCPQLGWKIRLEGDSAGMLRRIGRVRWLILSFWLLSFVFLVMGSIWFVSRLIQPLENLETGIKLVSSGLMGDELPVFSQDEIGRLTQTFNQMTRTLMLRNEEIRGKARELTFFNTITRIINQSVDLKTILDHSVQKILQLMHATSGMCYIFQPNLKQFKLISHFGLSDEYVATCSQLDWDQGLLAKIFSTGEPAMIREVPRHVPEYEMILHENIRDLLLVPLRSKKRTLGVLAVGSRRKRFFHYRDLDLLARIGDEIGMMVENAMLYAELQLKIKELEKANQDLKELDRLKNRFLSNVSHELRTPITTIKTYVELFLDNKIGSVDEVQKEKLLIVRRNLNNLMTLISDLLTLSRLEDQRQETLPLEVVSLTELAEQVVADTLEIARGKGLTIVRKGLVEPFPVHVHRQRIQQVLQNLLANAIKFTERGTITLNLRRVPQRSETGGGETVPREAVEVSVSDTGIGIPQEELGKLFQRFYQVDSSTTRKYVGTGLGLAIVNEILAVYHTEPKVESTLGTGSRFWFTLPLAETRTGTGAI